MDAQTVDEFDEIWRNRYCDVKTWLWCPLENVRGYFDEPVGFYLAFFTILYALDIISIRTWYY